MAGKFSVKGYQTYERGMAKAVMAQLTPQEVPLQDFKFAMKSMPINAAQNGWSTQLRMKLVFALAHF